MPDLSVHIGSLHLRNPVLTASGTFGYGDEYVGLINLSRLGGIITKTITLEPRNGNPPPRICETAAGMLNSIGLANVGVERFVREKLPFLRTVDTMVIVNIAGSTPEEFLAVMRRLELEAGIDAYELNYSCPNVKEGGMAFSSDARLASRLTTLLRKETRRPLIAKLTPNVTRVDGIAKAVEEAGADAVSLINTLVGMAVDIHTRKPKLGSITGGLSGPAIKPVALAKVYEVVQAVKIPVIGIGGIMTWQDAVEFIIVGATAVEVGTATFVDPRSAEQIVIGLEKYFTQKGLHCLEQLRGTMVV